MDREKELIKQDLSELETVEEVEKLREDAELLGHEDIVELANQKLNEIETKAKAIETTSESQVSQVNEFGGSNEEIDKRTGEVDQNIETVKSEALEKIKEAQNEDKGEVKTQTQEEIIEVQKGAPSEIFDSKKMIKEMTGGSEKIERFGRGYDNALNMYASSLTNFSDFEKYKDIFSQIAPEDKARIEQGIIGQEINNAELNWGVQEIQEKYFEKMEDFSKMFPESVENSKIYSTMSISNFDPNKLLEMYKISTRELGSMLQNAKFKMIDDIRKTETAELNRLNTTYRNLIDNAKNSDEKSKFERDVDEKRTEILDRSTKIKISKIEDEYKKRLAQVNI